MGMVSGCQCSDRLCLWGKARKAQRKAPRSVQPLSQVRLSATPWTAARQASLSIANSRSLLKLVSIELVMPSNCLILYCPLLLLPSIFPSIRVFSNESVLCTRWPKYWSFSFSVNRKSSKVPKFYSERSLSLCPAGHPSVRSFDAVERLLASYFCVSLPCIGGGYFGVLECRGKVMSQGGSPTDKEN